MPVSARFLADFTQFNTAVQSAEVKLKSFQTGSVGVEKALSRMTDSFSGRKIIQDATLAAEAIERIGGTSKLTESELRKVGAMATEATAKLKAMGQDVPDRLQKLAGAADEGGKKVGLLQKAASLAGPALAAMAGAFTVGAIINAIKNTGAWAGRIDDLSKKMGISVEAVQRLDFAARKSGASIDGISTAMVFLSRQLVGGDNATVEALAKLNLSIEQLRQLGLDKAFIQIAKAAAQMTDQNELNAVTTALMGRGAADLIPIFGTLEKDMAGAVVANKNMIEAGDRLGDSWGALMSGGTALLAGVLVPMEPAISAAARAMGKFAQANIDTSDAMRRLREERQKTGKFILGDPDEIIAAEVLNIQIERMVKNLDKPALHINPIRRIFPSNEEIRDIEHSARAIGKVTTASASAHKEIDIAAKTFNRWWGLMQAMPPVISDTAGEIQKLRDTIAGAGPNLDIFSRLVGARPGSIGTQGISQTIEKAQNAFQSFFSGIKGGLDSLWQGMSGGKGLSGLFSNLGGGLTQGFGNLLSGGLSSLISGGVGLAVQGATSLFGKLFGGDSKELKAAKASYAEMQREAQRLGISLEKAFKLKSVEDYQKAVAKAQKQISTFMDEQAADAERLTKAIEKYGFTFEQLGPAFRQQRLHEQATELIEDWRVLVASGIDLTLVNEKMAKSINEYLRLALRTGMEVPRAFEPILRQMIEQGLLLDENGVAITDLGQLQIKWSETMTQGFDRVVQKLQELIDKLQATGQAIGDIPKSVVVDVEYRERGPRPPGFPDGGDRRPVTSISGATLATVDGSVSTSSQGGHLTSPPPLDITLNIDGQTLARRLVRLTPDALALHGVH